MAETGLTQEHRDLVRAVFRDARETWPSVTLEFMEEQARRTLSGQRPQGGPGMMLADAFRRAGFITEVPR